MLNSINGKVPVCKKFFLDTFKVRKGRLKRVFNYANVGNDLRGSMVVRYVVKKKLNRINYGFEVM